LVDLTIQIQSKRSWHFFWKKFLYCSGVEGVANCPIARIFVVGTTGMNPPRDA
jgi:hypothetical protein